MEWSQASKDEAYEAEVQMDNSDRIVRETGDMRNELESYLYDMRDKIISESHLKLFCTDEERQVFSNVLEKTENWLYEDGFDATKSVYFDKLTDLKKMGDPIEFRYTESQTRSQVVSVLQRSIEKYKNWVSMAQADDKFEHITDDEIGLCYAKCDEISSWLYDMLDKQGSLPLSENPAFTVGEVQTKSRELTTVLSPIMNKPKPIPKKEQKREEKDEEKTSKKEAKEQEPQPMDTSEDAAPVESKDKASTPEPMDTK